MLFSGDFNFIPETLLSTYFISVYRVCTYIIFNIFNSLPKNSELLQLNKIKIT